MTTALLDDKRAAMSATDLRICSWNVNGIRAAVKKGFFEWLSAEQADIVGLQEVRADATHIAALGVPSDLHSHFAAATRPGYSGVGLLSRIAPDEVVTTLGDPSMDAEGRVQIARFGALTVANVYFPNGNGKERDNSRVPFKRAFYQAIFETLAPRARAGEPVLVMGDFNTAHREIDLARPKQNQNTSGFLLEEREDFDRLLAMGYVDTFRAFEPRGEHYSWWSQRFGVRAKNIGWRIDYVLASPGAMPFVRGATISPHVMGSDHCPVGVTLDRAVLGLRRAQ